MGIKTYRPYTPSRRQMTGSDFAEITKTTPEKSLLAPKSRQAGRNNQGKITVRHRGGGAKKKRRVRGTMQFGKTAKTKKAIVQLTADSADIEIFEGL